MNPTTFHEMTEGQSLAHLRRWAEGLTAEIDRAENRIEHLDVETRLLRLRLAIGQVEHELLAVGDVWIGNQVEHSQLTRDQRERMRCVIIPADEGVPA